MKTIGCTVYSIQRVETMTPIWLGHQFQLYTFSYLQDCANFGLDFNLMKLENNFESYRNNCLPAQTVNANPTSTISQTKQKKKKKTLALEIIVAVAVAVATL